MKTILSFGGGVNSSAIIALALQEKIAMPDYIVFSDTGAEWIATYTYINHLESLGIRITYLTGGDKFETLTEFCDNKKIVPSRLNRWCSDHWKITPVKRFARTIGEHEMWIGIDSSESHRAEKHSGGNVRFPLIEMGIDRSGCKKILMDSCLGVPVKSGCFFCPYQKKRQWIELKRDCQDDWEIAVRLEAQSMERSPEYTLTGSRWKLEDFVADLDKQAEFPFGIELDQKCECYFQ